MINKKIKVLVLTGDGINCEEETALAFREEGAEAMIVHIQDLINTPTLLKQSHILALPGGFSFGDELGSGQVLALKLKHSLGAELKQFIEDKKCIIGICNGFQALVRLGLLPKPFTERSMSLAHNTQGHFLDRWVNLKVPKSKCIWTSTIQDKEISLPIRHGEGKIIFAGNEKAQQSQFETLQGNGQIALRYSEDVNGSYQQIAGVCDPSGLIFGLMPHPEAAVSNWLLPSGDMKNSGKGIATQIFKNGIQYCETHL
jgi:phosphoribosylformylglycinamidine synthase I